MITFPNAKINIGLNVVAKRADGYHDIETVFYPISLCDVLEVVASKHENLFKTLGELDCTTVEDNLIYKAYVALSKDYKIPSFEVYLKKHIPTGAGLGGGSSDAAYMIKMLNDYASLGLSNEQMEEYAAKIGADCAFFVQNKPVFAEGIGNLFSNIDINLKGYKLLLVKPRVYVSTKDAYAHTVPSRREIPLVVAIKRPIEEWKTHVINDFEESVFFKYPMLADIKQKLYDAGALYASMSGSGSSFYGIFSYYSEEPTIEIDNIECKYWFQLK